jgi:hypothetical protein
MDRGFGLVWVDTFICGGVEYNVHVFGNIIGPAYGQVHKL